MHAEPLATLWATAAPGSLDRGDFAQARAREVAALTAAADQIDHTITAAAICLAAGDDQGAIVVTLTAADRAAAATLLRDRAHQLQQALATQVDESAPASAARESVFMDPSEISNVDATRPCGSRTLPKTARLNCARVPKPLSRAPCRTRWRSKTPPRTSRPILLGGWLRHGFGTARAPWTATPKSTGGQLVTLQISLAASSARTSWIPSRSERRSLAAGGRGPCVCRGPVSWVCCALGVSGATRAGVWAWRGVLRGGVAGGLVRWRCGLRCRRLG